MYNVAPYEYQIVAKPLKMMKILNNMMCFLFVCPFTVGYRWSVGFCWHRWKGSWWQQSLRRQHGGLGRGPKEPERAPQRYGPEEQPQ